MARSHMSWSGRRPVLSVALASACACAAVALYPSEARAGEFTLGVDADGTALLSPTSTNVITPSTLGGGFKLRFGDRFVLRGGVRLTPEIGYSFDHLFAGGAGEAVPGNANVVTDGIWNMNRVFAGARVGFGRWVVPTVYAHVGYAFRTVSDETVTILPNNTGPTFDAGVALDFHIARHLSLGPHVEYTLVDMQATGQSIPQWMTFGGHVDFIF
jgi:outer membrane protein with beta-barrel domain